MFGLPATEQIPMMRKSKDVMIFNQTVAVTIIASLRVINHHLILSFYIEPFIFVLRIPPLLFVVKKIKISDWISGVFGYFLFPFVFKLRFFQYFPA